MEKHIRDTKAYYEKNAIFWTAKKTDSFYHEKGFKKILRLLPAKSTVIDIGCAGGVHVPLFLGLGRSLRYVGMDISRAFLKIARRRYPQLTFLEGNIADRHTLPKKKFDAFFAAAVLMHVPLELWDEMFQNIENIVKSGGYGYVVLPTSHPSGDRAINDPRQFTILSESEQKAIFKERSWKIITTGTHHGFSVENVWCWYIVRLPNRK